MKKKIVTLITMLMAVCMLAGCGSKEAVALKDTKTEKYVKLGEYKNLPVTTTPEEVDEEEVAERYLSLYAPYVNKKNGITDRVVQEGDTVVLDYEGKMMGIAISGGSGKNYQLTIGSDTFIEGFEDGVIGYKPGRTYDLNLTFPADYRNSTLAGKDTVFTITVHYIIPAEPDEAIVKELGIEGVTTHEELYQYAHDQIAAELAAEYRTKVETEVLERLSENCTYKKLPEGLLEKYSASALVEIQKQAANYGLDVNYMVSLMYNTNVDGFRQRYSEYAVKQGLTLQAIANRENLNISDEELDLRIAAEAEAAGVSVESFVGESDKESLREQYMIEKVLDFLIENAAFTSK